MNLKFLRNPIYAGLGYAMVIIVIYTCIDIQEKMSKKKRSELVLWLKKAVWTSIASMAMMTAIFYTNRTDKLELNIGGEAATINASDVLM